MKLDLLLQQMLDVWISSDKAAESQSLVPLLPLQKLGEQQIDKPFVVFGKRGDAIEIPLGRDRLPGLPSLVQVATRQGSQLLQRQRIVGSDKRGEVWGGGPPKLGKSRQRGWLQFAGRSPDPGGWNARDRPCVT